MIQFLRAVSFLIVSLFLVQAKAAEKKNWNQLELLSLDQKKVKFSELWRDSKLVALVSIGLDCPMVQKSFPKYEKSQKKWRKDKIRFFYVESSSDPDFQKIKKMKSQYQSTLPIYMDPKQELARALGFLSTNQVVLFDPQSGNVLYDGALDSSINFWKQSDQFVAFLDRAIQEHLAGKPIRQPKTEAFGCAITYQEDSK